VMQNIRIPSPADMSRGFSTSRQQPDTTKQKKPPTNSTNDFFIAQTDQPQSINESTAHHKQKTHISAHFNEWHQLPDFRTN